MSKRYKYVTIKQNDQLFRVLHFEEGTDGSIYIRRPLFAKSKRSYHSNNGLMKPPFQTHQYGCGGNMISESIEQRSKFITDYTGAFLELHLDQLPVNSCVKVASDNDVIIDIGTDDIKKYVMACFSEKRSDLLSHDFDNAVIGGVSLITTKFVVGCFERPKRKYAESK